MGRQRISRDIRQARTRRLDAYRTTGSKVRRFRRQIACLTSIDAPDSRRDFAPAPGTANGRPADDVPSANSPAIAQPVCQLIVAGLRSTPQSKTALLAFLGRLLDAP